MQKNEVIKLDGLEIKDKIYSIRGHQVMLDSDLAELYGVKTKRLNEQVKRNIDRFPKSFCFQLTDKEKSEVVANCDHLTKLKFSHVLPYTFTQEGVAMLSAVLKSITAIQISVKVMSAFVEMRKLLTTNAQIFERVANTEIKLLNHDRKFEQVFYALENNDTLPKQGVFFESQIFDAYKFVSDLFRSAKKSVTIIDNYIDNSVLLHLTEVKKDIKVKILTRSISDKLKQDVIKFEKQYFNIELITFKKAHDRFIIIDENEIYLIGASLKDLGKKLFGFSKMDKTALNISTLIEEIRC
ncbi:MAG: ORF6N domain-containing protein [Candidatus Delongbacteria bacterium]|nr:ORF6N domain-containing protein [Candidatus Delongbacteria bacterium]